MSIPELIAVFFISLFALFAVCALLGHVLKLDDYLDHSPDKHF